MPPMTEQQRLLHPELRRLRREPYKNRKIFVDVIAIINVKKYRIRNVPLTYLTTNMPIVKDRLGNIVEPVTDITSRDIGPAMCTIEEMVDMYVNNVAFTFDSNDQVVEIATHLDEYFGWYQRQRPAPQDHRAFATKAYPFYELMLHKRDVIRKGRHIVSGTEEPVSLTEALFKKFF